MSVSESNVSVENGRLTAPFVLEYSYKRATGPIIGDFLTGLRDGKILGGKTARGPVVCPPHECDPLTGEDLEGLVEVGPGGVLETFAVVHKPLPSHPKQEAFAFATIRLDGADTAITHVVMHDDLSALKKGQRVTAVFAKERTGFITDIDHFALEEA